MEHLVHRELLDRPVRLDRAERLVLPEPLDRLEQLELRVHRVPAVLMVIAIKQ